VTREILVRFSFLIVTDMKAFPCCSLSVMAESRWLRRHDDSRRTHRIKNRSERCWRRDLSESTLAKMWVKVQPSYEKIVFIVVCYSNSNVSICSALRLQCRSGQVYSRLEHKTVLWKLTAEMHRIGIFTIQPNKITSDTGYWRKDRKTHWQLIWVVYIVWVSSQ